MRTTATMELDHVSLFTGIGGIDLGLEWAGFRTIATCDNKEFSSKIVKKRFPNANHHSNIYDTDFTQYAGRVAILSGGFPCQPFSIAGQRRGEEDDRYLWPQMLRAIREAQPRWVIAENVFGLTSMVQPESFLKVEGQEDTVRYYEKVLPRIIGSLQDLGYELPYAIGGLPIVFVIPAAGVGAPHQRQRVFIVAAKDPHGNAAGRLQAAWSKRLNGNVGTASQVWDVAYNDIERGEVLCKKSNWKENEKKVGNDFLKSPSRPRIQQPVTYSIRARRKESQQKHESELHHANAEAWRADANANMSRQKELNASAESSAARFSAKLPSSAWREWPTQSPVCGGNDGIPNRLDRLEALGNAVVPQIPYVLGCFIKQIETELSNCNHE